MTAPRGSLSSRRLAAAALFLALVGRAAHGLVRRRTRSSTPRSTCATASAIEDGAVPYRDIRPEYPPGALPVFVLPALLSDDEDGFRDAFEWLMAACGVAMVLLAGVALAGLRASRSRTIAALALAALLPAPARLGRADPLRPLARCARRRRARRARPRARPARLRPARRGGGGEALPGGARAARLAYVWRRRGRREALVCLGLRRGVVALVFLPFLVVAPGRRRAQPRAAALAAAPDREPRLGALPRCAPSARARRRDALGPRLAEPARDRAGVVAALLSLLQIGVLVWIWLRRPGTAEELVRWSAAALVAFVALGKVLSPQFLIWLVPAVPLVAGLRGVRASDAARRRHSS